MPNIVIRIPTGVLHSDSKRLLSEQINALAAQVEQIPDHPKNRFLCWVLIEEIPADNWTCGAQDVSAAYIPVLIQVHLPAGVLDDAARAQYALGMQQAFTKVLADDRRSVLTSCLFNEVADGTWGVNGTLWQLPEFARHAGFRHLQHLVG